MGLVIECAKVAAPDLDNEAAGYQTHEYFVVFLDSSAIFNNQFAVAIKMDLRCKAECAKCGISKTFKQKIIPKQKCNE